MRLCLDFSVSLSFARFGRNDVVAVIRRTHNKQPTYLLFVLCTNRRLDDSRTFFVTLSFSEESQPFPKNKNPLSRGFYISPKYYDFMLFLKSSYFWRRLAEMPGGICLNAFSKTSRVSGSV